MVAAAQSPLLIHTYIHTHTQKKKKRKKKRKKRRTTNSNGGVLIKNWNQTRRLLQGMPTLLPPFFFFPKCAAWLVCSSLVHVNKYNGRMNSIKLGDFHCAPRSSVIRNALFFRAALCFDSLLFFPFFSSSFFLSFLACMFGTRICFLFDSFFFSCFLFHFFFLGGFLSAAVAALNTSTATGQHIFIQPPL